MLSGKTGACLKEKNIQYGDAESAEGRPWEVPPSSGANIAFCPLFVPHHHALRIAPCLESAEPVWRKSASNGAKITHL